MSLDWRPGPRDLFSAEIALRRMRSARLRQLARDAAGALIRGTAAICSRTARLVRLRRSPATAMLELDRTHAANAGPAADP